MLLTHFSSFQNIWGRGSMGTLPLTSSLQF